MYSIQVFVYSHNLYFYAQCIYMFLIMYFAGEPLHMLNKSQTVKVQYTNTNHLLLPRSVWESNKLGQFPTHVFTDFLCRCSIVLAPKIQKAVFLNTEKQIKRIELETRCVYST